MRRYTVVWLRSVEDELMEIWMAADDKHAVTAAADTLDEMLALNPSTQGVEIAEGLRGVFLHPIKILFTVREDDRIVEVVRVVRM